MASQEKKKKGEGISASDVMTNLHALDSKISILAQRIKVMEDNQRVLSQTLVKVKKKTETQADLVTMKGELEQLKMELENLNPAKVVTFDNLHKLVDEKVKELLSK